MLIYANAISSIIYIYIMISTKFDIPYSVSCSINTCSTNVIQQFE